MAAPTAVRSAVVACLVLSTPCTSPPLVTTAGPCTCTCPCGVYSKSRGSGAAPRLHEERYNCPRPRHSDVRKNKKVEESPDRTNRLRGQSEEVTSHREQARNDATGTSTETSSPGGANTANPPLPAVPPARQRYASRLQGKRHVRSQNPASTPARRPRYDAPWGCTLAHARRPLAHRHGHHSPCQH